MYYYSALRTKDILQYITTWMNFEHIIVTKRQILLWFHLYMVFRVVRIIQEEYGGCCGDRKIGELLFSGYRISGFTKMKSYGDGW